MVFHICNCLAKISVKYASCNLLDSALTWWNSHKRTVGVDAAYAMTWKALIKLMLRLVPGKRGHKLKGYAIKNAENKRRFDNNSKYNRGQQQPFKRQNVARAYTVRNMLQEFGLKGHRSYCASYEDYYCCL
ncbi:hypothetical protein Tco_1020854 [Tanacetum coccineum]